MLVDILIFYNGSESGHIGSKLGGCGTLCRNRLLLSDRAPKRPPISDSGLPNNGCATIFLALRCGRKDIDE